MKMLWSANPVAESVEGDGEENGGEEETEEELELASPWEDSSNLSRSSSSNSQDCTQNGSDSSCALAAERMDARHSSRSLLATWKVEQLTLESHLKH